MTQLQKALKLATKAHQGQNRKFGSGEAYITHPIAVSKAVEGKDAKCVAMLHDIVEDTDVTLDDLYRQFEGHIVDAVDCLTKREDEPYMEFVQRAMDNRLARRVKIADIEHNMATIPIEEQGLLNRYRRALGVLRGEQ